MTRSLVIKDYLATLEIASDEIQEQLRHDIRGFWRAQIPAHGDIDRKIVREIALAFFERERTSYFPVSDQSSQASILNAIEGIIQCQRKYAVDNKARRSNQDSTPYSFQGAITNSDDDPDWEPAGYFELPNKEYGVVGAVDVEVETQHPGETSHSHGFEHTTMARETEISASEPEQIQCEGEEGTPSSTVFVHHIASVAYQHQSPLLAVAQPATFAFGENLWHFESIDMKARALGAAANAISKKSEDYLRSLLGVDAEQYLELSLYYEKDYFRTFHRVLMQHCRQLSASSESIITTSHCLGYRGQHFEFDSTESKAAALDQAMNAVSVDVKKDPFVANRQNKIRYLEVALHQATTYRSWVEEMLVNNGGRLY